MRLVTHLKMVNTSHFLFAILTMPPSTQLDTYYLSIWKIDSKLLLWGSGHPPGQGHLCGHLPVHLPSHLPGQLPSHLLGKLLGKLFGKHEESFHWS